MRLRRVLPFATAAVIAAVAVGFALHRVPDAPVPTPMAAGAVPSAQTRAGAPASEHGFFDMAMTQPAAQPARQPGGGDWRTFEAKLAGAQSLRAFVFDVLRQPKEGGVYYAFSVITRCKANLRTDTAGLPPMQRQAIEGERTRCDFSAQELDDAYRQIAAIRNLHFADDPILGPVFHFLQAKDNDAKAAVLGDAIDAGNPMVIGAIVSTAIQKALPPSVVPQGEGSGNYAYYATMLVECQLGAACSGDRSMMVMDLCTKHGWCADNVRDALRIGLGDKFAPLDQLATQMTNDVRKRNYPPLLRGA